MMVLAPVVVLMLLEPHLSGTILILSIGAIMMFVGGTSLKWFGLGGGVAVGGLAAALIAFPDLVPYAMTRIEMWQNPYLDVQGKGHQTIQSLLAIGSGGVMGLGLGIPARSTCMSRSRRTTLSSASSVRNSALLVRWW